MHAHSSPRWRFGSDSVDDPLVLPEVTVGPGTEGLLSLSVYISIDVNVNAIAHKLAALGNFMHNYCKNIHKRRFFTVFPVNFTEQCAQCR